MEEPDDSEMGAVGGSIPNDIGHRSNAAMDDSRIEGRSTQKTNERKWENIIYTCADAAPYRVYVELKGNNKAAKINKYSVGAALREVEGIRGHIIDMKYVGRYKVMVIINNFIKANLLVEKINLQSATYKAYVPSHLVSMTGVIPGVPIDLTDDEIRDGLESEFPVLRVSRLHRFANNDRIPLARISVTFRTTQLPDRVKLFDCPAKVLPFVRKVDLCEKCLRYGHRTANCRGTRRCQNCSDQHEDSHEYEMCEKPVKCAGCKSTKHATTESTCPERKRQQNINELRAKRNLTYIEAREQIPMLSQNPFELLSNLQEFPSLAETVEANVGNLKKQWDQTNIPREAIQPAVKLWKPKDTNKEKNKKRGTKRPKANGDSEAEDSAKEECARKTREPANNGVCLNNPHKTTEKDIEQIIKEVTEKTTHNVNLRFQEQVMKFYSLCIEQDLPTGVKEKIKDISRQCFDLSKTIV